MASFRVISACLAVIAGFGATCNFSSPPPWPLEGDIAIQFADVEAVQAHSVAAARVIELAPPAASMATCPPVTVTGHFTTEVGLTNVVEDEPQLAEARRSVTLAKREGSVAAGTDVRLDMETPEPINTLRQFVKGAAVVSQ